MPNEINNSDEIDIDRIFHEGTLIDQAIDRAGREAIRHAIRFRVPLVVWQDGKIVEIQPNELEWPDEN